MFGVCVKKYLLPLFLICAGLPALAMEEVTKKVDSVVLTFKDNVEKKFEGNDAQLIVDTFKTIGNLSKDFDGTKVTVELPDYEASSFGCLFSVLKTPQSHYSFTDNKQALKAIALADFLEMPRALAPFVCIKDTNFLVAAEPIYRDSYRKIFVQRLCEVLYKAPQEGPKPVVEKEPSREDRWTSAPDGECWSPDPEDKPLHVPSKSIHNADKSRWAFFDSEKRAIIAFSRYDSAARFSMSFEGAEQVRGTLFPAYFNNNFLEVARYDLKLELVDAAELNHLSWDALMRLYEITRASSVKSSPDTIMQIEEYCNAPDAKDAHLLRTIFGIAQYNENVKKPLLQQSHAVHKKAHILKRSKELRFGLGMVGFAGLLFGATKLFPSLQFSKLGSALRWGSYVTGALSLTCFWDVAKAQRSIWQLEKKEAQLN